MKYMTQKNILIALGVIAALALIVWGIQNSPASQQQETSTGEQTATTTEEGVMATTTIDSVETEASEEAVTTNSAQTANTQTSTSVTTSQQQPEKKQVDLGPRKPATVSPAAALQYFAEAMAAGNQERALSYFAESVRDQYRASFKEYEGKEHPVVRAYFTGEVSPVELIQPEHGIYEIRVSPVGSKLAYTVNFFFENGEFRIWEL